MANITFHTKIIENVSCIGIRRNVNKMSVIEKKTKKPVPLVKIFTCVALSSLCIVEGY